MQPGHILVADHQGIYIIRMTGDVRLTLSVSFDNFITTMFTRDDCKAIVFDLTDAQAVDSTTLGLMAKISLKAQNLRGLRPIILSNNPGIDRTLECMGFDEIFDIMPPEQLAHLDLVGAAEQDLPENIRDEALTKSKILEAHKVLMQMNDKNRDTFLDLVKSLEGS